MVQFFQGTNDSQIKDVFIRVSVSVEIIMCVTKGQSQISKASML